MSRYVLIHHGIEGQKWGIRRFQNEDGTLTEEGKRRYQNKIDKYVEKAKKQEEKSAKLSQKAAKYSMRGLATDNWYKEYKGAKFAKKAAKLKLKSLKNYEKANEIINKYFSIKVSDL